MTCYNAMMDMKSLPDAELKNLATTPGPKRYLAFDEMARRIRDNPSGWADLQGEPWWEWSPNDIRRRPNATEMEWAILKWSQHLNDVAPELEQKQNVRIKELEGHLNQDPDSLELKYYNVIGENLRRSDKDGGT